MQLATVGDAETALFALNNGLISTIDQVSSALSSSNTITGLAGGNMVASASASLLQQLVSETASVTQQLVPLDPSTPLTAQQQGQLQLLQKEVIDARTTIGQAISSVDWTYGNLFDDTGIQLDNWFTQAAASVSGALGINWTAVTVVVILVVGIFLYTKV